MGFGGYNLSSSNQNLIDTIKKYELNNPQKVDKYVLIDVHSGLGPSGVDSLLIEFNTTDDFEMINQKFPPDYESVGSSHRKLIGGIIENFKNQSFNSAESASSGYELTIGTLTEDFCKKWLNSNQEVSIRSKICITQEFGTVSSIAVGKNLIDENYSFHYSKSKIEKDLYSQRLKDSFYVNSVEWKRNVVRRGLILFLQAEQYVK